MQETGILQIHGTFKTWKTDPTTAGDGLSYAYHENGDYEQTDEALLKEVVALVRGQEETECLSACEVEFGLTGLTSTSRNVRRTLHVPSVVSVQ